MRFQKQHYSFSALASATTLAAFLGLPIMPGSAELLPLAGKVEPAAQSSRNPHEWGMRSNPEAARPPVQSARNPHEWGLSSSTVASAPAAQSDKNPHAWGIIQSTRAAQVMVGDR